jgi:ribosomal peptide maturation radical SAM protein 1
MFLGELLYSYILFPRNRTKIREFLRQYKKESFLEFISAIKKFSDSIFNEIPWEEYGWIGFTITYIQLLSSIYFAKKIKSVYPNIKIILGGINCVGEIGQGLMRNFREIDFIINGEGEESLFRLLNSSKNFHKIPNLIWRNGEKVVINKITSQIKNLDILPFPDYSDYFKLVRNRDFHKNLSFILPIETSRGCWFTPKCYYCNYNCVWVGYRAKSKQRVLRELNYLSCRYKLKDFYFVDSIINPRVKEIFTALSKLGKGFTFSGAYFRVPTNKDFLEILLQGGVKNINIGIEAFSTRLLRKMAKGTTVIENIQALKWCEEFGINLAYNLIPRFPTEEKEDIEETIRNIDYAISFQPPHTPLSNYVHLYGSGVYKEPGRFNIKKIYTHRIYRVLFPETIYKNIRPFLYEIKLKKPRDYGYEKLNNKVEEWERSYQNKSCTLYYKEIDIIYQLLITEERNQRYICLVDLRKTYIYFVAR